MPQLYKSSGACVYVSADDAERLLPLINLINGAIEAKAKAQLKDNKVLEQFKEVDSLPDTEKNLILKVISALIRDYKTSLSYK